MSKTVQDTWSAAMAAVKKSPDEAQEALAEEFSERVASFSGSLLSAEQRAEVARRLALPPRTVPASHINTILDRYTQSL